MCFCDAVPQRAVSTTLSQEYRASCSNLTTFCAQFQPFRAWGFGAGDQGLRFRAWGLGSRV
eukprot:1001078-Rhodomonas_salina.2